MIALAVARGDDQSAIKALADRHRKDIGFVLAPAIRASISEGALWVAKDGPEVVGFVRFHHRLDGVTKLYEVCVLENARGRGVGRLLIGAIREQALLAGQHAIVLKCPEDLPANEFYRQLGFEDAGLEQGKRRRLRIWRLRIAGGVEQEKP